MRESRTMKKTLLLVGVLSLILIAPSVYAQTFPDDWTGKYSITTNASMVDSTETDFPYYIDLSNLPADFWNNVQNDGGDIRVTTDDAGTSQVAMELVSIDTTAETGELYFKDSTNSASDKTYYVWYDSDNTETFPGDTDTFGRNNVWTVHEAVWHFNEDPSGTAPQLTDSTGNGHDGTSQGSMTSGDLVDGKVGKAWDFDGSDDGVVVPDSAGIDTNGNATYSIWFKPSDTDFGTGEYLLSKRDSAGAFQVELFVDESGGDRLRNRIRDGTNSAVINQNQALSTSSWSMIFSKLDRTNTLKLFFDGSEVASVADNVPGDIQTDDDLRIGNEDDTGNPWNGLIDELRMSKSLLSSGWITTEYNMQNDNTAFWSVGASQADSLSTTGISPAVPNSDSVLTDNATYTSSNGVDVNITADWKQNNVIFETDTFNNVANGTTVSATVNLSDYSINDADNITLTWNATSPNTFTETTDGPVEVKDFGTLRVENATEKISDNLIQTFDITSPASYTGQTTNGTLIITSVDVGTYNFTVDASAGGYLNTRTVEATITKHTTTTINASGFFTTNVSLNVTNINGEIINTWDAIFTTTSYGGVSVTASNGATIGLLNATWQVRVENATQAGTNYAKDNQTITLTTQTTPTINFTLYQSNSFNIEFRDEQTNNLINDRNITVEYISSLEFQNRTTTNGTVFISGLIPTEIQIRYEPTDYKRRNAYFFITNQSFTNITLYSLNNTEGVLGIITATDQFVHPESGRLIKLMRGYQLVT